MLRLAFVSFVVFSAVYVGAQNIPSSDPLAVSLAQQSVAALTGGAPITDATLTGIATRIAGSDIEKGTVTLNVKGVAESRLDFSLSGGTRTEIRNDTATFPQGAAILNGGNQKALAMHNCRINAGWFFPELSALAETADPAQIFVYVGLEQRKGASVHHLRTFRYAPAKRPDVTAIRQAVSTMDVYLDSTSLLPLAFAFNTHPDDDALTNIGLEVDFYNYQPFSGILVPARIQKLIWNGLALDISITGATFNTGLLDDLFTITAQAVN
jgi:hypothetical protein